MVYTGARLTLHTYLMIDCAVSRTLFRALPFLPLPSPQTLMRIVRMLHTYCSLTFRHQNRSTC